MPSLSQKFYGLSREMPEQERNDLLKRALNQNRYGVTYNTTKYFLNESAAKQFFNNISQGAQLIKKNLKTGGISTIKSK